MNHRSLTLRRLGIDTQREHVVYMHRDCPVCRAEGFVAQARVQVALQGRRIVATLAVVDSDLITPGQAGLSAGAWAALGASEGDTVAVTHAPTLDSLSDLRAKIYGHRLGRAALRGIVADISQGLYDDLHIAAFITACAAGRMSVDETIELTRAMVDAGERIRWGRSPIADKHCVGGLPGNRTTPIVVALAAAAGLTMPKTSSRAITSPAGTADVMATLTRVDLDLPTLRRVVEATGACLAWGGALALSPADDALIRVERPLDIDSEAQLVASVLSKKIAAGATHVVLDLPVGPTAKLRTEADADAVQALLQQVGDAHGLQLRILRSDGSQPVGRGIGPALEAWDVLAVLRGQPDAPADLRARALALAAVLLEFADHCPPGQGAARAEALLAGGQAWAAFQRICQAQGGLREPPRAEHTQPLTAPHDGVVARIDNRLLARAAKLTGAPSAPAAGLLLHARLGQRVQRGEPLFTLHAQTPGELAYARAWAHAHPAFDIAKDIV